MKKVKNETRTNKMWGMDPMGIDSSKTLVRMLL